MWFINIRLFIMRRFSVGRQILTKKANVYDRRGQADAEDITNSYKSSEGGVEDGKKKNAPLGSP